ncbi:MAG TPA: cyclic nucleotide-binding domain-containing protein [Myxococcaceae bacterium]|nr:cyclic nucleotide-binding domain-containing protein [Myxococcaceae bacterium]
MDPARLKADAGAALAAGHFSRAASLYAAYCAGAPRDRQSHLRLGDAYARAGEKARAIDAYLAAARGFAEDGFLARAIAASKRVLELDPNHTQMQRILADLYAKRAAGGQALRTLLGRPAPARDEPLPVRPFEPIGAEAPAIIEPGTPSPAPAPTQRARPESTELLVTEYMLDPDPKEPTLEEVLRTEANHHLDTPVPLGPPAAPRPDLPASTAGTATNPAPSAPGPAPAAPLPTPAPAPVPRFVELSLEDAGGVGGLELPVESPPPAQPKPGEDPGYIDLQLEDEPAAPPPLALDPGPLIHALEQAAELAPAEPSLARNPFVAPAARDVPRAPLFSDLSHEAFVELVERCPLRRFEAGDRIIQQGEPGDSFYVICEGRVSVLREDDGLAHPVAALEAGEFFGEVALLAGGPRTASVYALSEDTQLLEISGQLLMELAGRHPGVASALKTFCRQRLLSNLLSTSALFRPLERGERRELATRFRARDALAGEVVITQGGQGDGLYVILAGEVEVLRDGGVAGTLGAGDVFGEMSLLDGVPPNATVRTLRRTSLLRLPVSELSGVLERYPAVRAHLEALRDARAEINARLPLTPDDEPLFVV